MQSKLAVKCATGAAAAATAAAITNKQFNAQRSRNMYAAAIVLFQDNFTKLIETYAF